MKPTYEELERKVERLEELLKLALEKIDKLEKQLNRNSKNSSLPPQVIKKIIHLILRKSLDRQDLVNPVALYLLIE
jgi:predicted RNase H-like nuclease (RuvC/YqgF family)